MLQGRRDGANRLDELPRVRLRVVLVLLLGLLLHLLLLLPLLVRGQQLSQDRLDVHSEAARLSTLPSMVFNFCWISWSVPWMALTCCCVFRSEWLSGVPSRMGSAPSEAPAACPGIWLWEFIGCGQEACQVTD